MLSKLRSLFSDTKGLAAIEFAITGPVLATMFLGAIELTDALLCNQRVTGLAAIAGDIVAQEQTVTTSDLSNVYSAMSSIMYPFTGTTARIVISSVVDNGSGGAKVAWSCGHNASARAANTAITVPSGIIVSGGSVILAEVTYPYTSPVGHFVLGTRNLTSKFYSKPRRSSSIALSGACPT